MPPSQELTHTHVYTRAHTRLARAPTPPPRLLPWLWPWPPALLSQSCPNWKPFPLLKGAARRHKAAPSGPQMSHVQKERLDGGLEHLGDTQSRGENPCHCDPWRGLPPVCTTLFFIFSAILPDLDASTGEVSPGLDTDRGEVSPAPWLRQAPPRSLVWAWEARCLPMRHTDGAGLRGPGEVGRGPLHWPWCGSLS